MKKFKLYRYTLLPTEEQAEKLEKAAQHASEAWDWAYDFAMGYKRSHGTQPTDADLSAAWTHAKRSNEVPNAYYFDSQIGLSACWYVPKYMKYNRLFQFDVDANHQIHDVFVTSGVRFDFDNCAVELRKIGKIRMACDEEFPEGLYKGSYCKLEKDENGNWFITPFIRQNKKPVGLEKASRKMFESDAHTDEMHVEFDLMARGNDSIRLSDGTTIRLSAKYLSMVAKIKGNIAKMKTEGAGTRRFTTAERALERNLQRLAYMTSDFIKKVIESIPMWYTTITFDGYMIDTENDVIDMLWARLKQEIQDEAGSRTIIFKDPRRTPIETARRLSVRQAQILGMMRRYPTTTIDIIAMNLGVCDRTVAREVELLQDWGFLLREGGRKEGQWIVNLDEKDGSWERQTANKIA